MRKRFEHNGEVLELSPFSMEEFDCLGLYTGYLRTQFLAWLEYNKLHLLHEIRPLRGELRLTDESSILSKLYFDKDGNDDWRTLAELGYETTD